MKSQGDNHDKEKRGNHPRSRLTYLAAGLGIGAIVGILLAPRSGDDTREWLATQWKNGMDSVNTKVGQTRQHFAQMIDRGQQQVSDAVNQVSDAINREEEAVKKVKTAAV